MAEAQETGFSTKPLWHDTAVEPVETAAPNGDLDVDVAVIGAGFTGLSAAFHLADAGIDTAVFEARHVGFGASGRSGGQVNLGLNEGPAALIDRFGSEQGRRLIGTVTGAPDELFTFVRNHQLNCDAVRNGWAIAGASKKRMTMLRSMATDYKDFGDPFEEVGKSDFRKLTGAQGFEGGLFCRLCGSVQPLSYTFELARLALTQGARIYSNTPIQAVRRNGASWQLKSDHGLVHAHKILVCTNGYTDELVDDLAKTLIPVRSLQIATKPLTDSIRQEVMPNQITFVDKRRMVFYLRYDRHGRLCAGGRGPMRDEFRSDDFDELKDLLIRVFPQVKGSRIDYHWGGRVAVTRDYLPYLSEWAPGLCAGMGYNGRGVAMATVMGRVLAEWAMSDPDKPVAFPKTRPKTFPLHRFHPNGAWIRMKWGSLMDRIEK